VEAVLGQIADVTMGQSPPGSSYNTTGDGLPFMQGSAEFGEHFPEPVKWCSSPARVAEPGDVLLSVRAPVGDTNIANQRLAIGRGLATVSGSKHATSEFLRLLIQHNASELIANSGTGMFASITGKSLKGFKVQLPPMSEQRRIVDLMSSVDSYIAALQQQADAARSARSAVLSELLSAGGDDWDEMTIGSIAEVVGGGTPSTKVAEYWGGEIVWLTPTEVVPRDGQEIFDSERHITTTGLKNSGAQLLPPGSVILTSRASVGFVALAGIELCTNQGFQSLIPNDYTMARFLMFWIQANRHQFDSRAAGSTFKEISRSNVRSIKIALPPLAEQKRIVEIVSSMDVVIQSADNAVADAKSLRSGLLSDLLSGAHEIPESYDRLLGVA